MVVLSWELIRNKTVRFINSVYQLPQCYISSNPYTGSTGIAGLLNCIAIRYGGLWAAMRFYVPSVTPGIILSSHNTLPPIIPGSNLLWVYIGTDGNLRVGDLSSGEVVLPLTAGWHTLIAGEYYMNGTYYVVAYLDTPSNYGTNSTTAAPSLFQASIFPYSFVGTGFGAWPYTTNIWSYFNGSIQYIALYGGNSPNIQSTLVQWLAQTGGKALPPTISGAGPYALYVPISLSNDGSVWFDVSGNGNDATQIINNTNLPISTSPAILELLPEQPTALVYGLARVA